MDIHIKQWSLCLIKYGDNTAMCLLKFVVGFNEKAAVY